MIREAFFSRKRRFINFLQHTASVILFRSPKTIITIVCLAFIAAACSKISTESRERDTAQVQSLINSGHNVNEPNPITNRPPLHDAVTGGSVDLVKQLIEKGANINAADNVGATPLLLSCSLNKTEIPMLLIDKGADINARDMYGYTPLHWAVYYGHNELVTLLIDKGANIDLADFNGMTPLICACYYGRFEIAMKLIDSNANASAIDNSGKKASDYVRTSFKFGKTRARILMDRMHLNEDFRSLQQHSLMLKLKRILRKVQDCVSPDVDYKISIIENNTANAWVDVSGSINFSRQAVEDWDEDELTLVAAQEIAHDRLGHVATSTGDNHANSTAPWQVWLKKPMINSISKTQEYNATKLASEYCERCFGMDRDKQLQLMRSIKENSKSQEGGFLATYPSWDDRINAISDK